jgi:hypothetical protein
MREKKGKEIEGKGKKTKIHIGIGSFPAPLCVHLSAIFAFAFFLLCLLDYSILGNVI